MPKRCASSTPRIGRRARRRSHAGLALRVATWRAELAYFQGRYSEVDDIVDRLVAPLERRGDWAYAAFALRIRIAVLLARTDYEGAAALADRAIEVAEASGDDYVMVQILNVLGAVAFDRATSKLDGPHARAHLSALDPRDTAPMEADAREALRLLRARPRRGRARALRVRGVVRGRQHRAARDPAGQCRTAPCA